MDLASYDRLFPTQDFMPKRLIQEPDWPAAPGRMSQARNHRLSRSEHARAVPRPMGVSFRATPHLTCGSATSPSRRPDLRSGRDPLPATARAGVAAKEAVRHRQGVRRRHARQSIASTSARPAVGPEHLASLASGVLREGAPALLDLGHTTLPALLPRDDRPAALPRGVREQAEQIVAEAGSRLVVTEGC